MKLDVVSVSISICFGQQVEVPTVLTYSNNFKLQKPEQLLRLQSVHLL